MKTKSQKGTSERVSEVLWETLLEEDFPLGGSRSCCLQPCCPSISSKSQCREAKIAARRSLPLNCRDYPHRGGNFERGSKAFSYGEDAIWEAFQETIWARVTASQKMPRGDVESIFAVRHQDLSQGADLSPCNFATTDFPAERSSFISLHPLRRDDYQNNSVNIILCNCPGAITGFLCRAPENNSPNFFSCKSPSPVRAPPGLCPGTTEITERRGSYRIRKIIPQKFYYVIAPGALTGFSCRAPENNSKINLSCL